MSLGYFNAKNKLKKIYNSGMKAIKKKDIKYINFLILELGKFKNTLNDKFVIDPFGIYILNKDIKQIQLVLSQHR